jgi:hypothetical protein
MQPFGRSKNLPKTLCKNSPKNPQKPHKNPAAKNLAKIFYENINKNLLKYSKNFLILPKTFKLKQKQHEKI